LGCKCTGKGQKGGKPEGRKASLSHAIVYLWDMLPFLTILWCFSLAILTVYNFVVFRIRMKESGIKVSEDLPGVSIVIAVKNGSAQLSHNIGSIIAQDYSLFEIIIVDDYSSADERMKLEEILKAPKKFFLFHNQEKPGKKQALRLGIENAKYPFILCTDADCRPSSDEWIKSMAAKSERSNMVLGYSPYLQQKGLLNLFLRFETVMTAIQYLSWTMLGKPYMGVGRNMLYPRNLFQHVNPYDHSNIPYGDDDLWVQKASTMASIQVNLDRSSFVYSDPPHSWSKWLKQKHRHMSAGHHYDKKAWWRPGLFGFALFMYWFLLPFILLGTMLNWIVVLFIAGLFIRWIAYTAWTKKLGDSDTVVWYPLLELGYALYLAGMGLFTAVVKKKSWN
jgi:glycosyltransferase involved in cell wall biosynthesis